MSDPGSSHLPLKFLPEVWFLHGLRFVCSVDDGVRGGNRGEGAATATDARGKRKVLQAEDEDPYQLPVGDPREHLRWFVDCSIFCVRSSVSL